jgi:hypothetical protein
VTFYSIYNYSILAIFPIYPSYLFDFSYVVGFGSKDGEVSLNRDKRRNSNHLRKP